MAGELKGLAEPALVLTPPAQASETDDGQLAGTGKSMTSSRERAELLDALLDLVSPVTPVWEKAWADECEDRMVAIDHGEMHERMAARKTR